MSVARFIVGRAIQAAFDEQHARDLARLADYRRCPSCLFWREMALRANEDADRYATQLRESA